MNNFADDRNLNLTLNFILSVFMSTIMFSCGPRSGIHEDSKETSEKNQFICGNAIRESENFERLKNLNLSGDPYIGKKLFKQNCAVCHAMSDQKLTGPGLAGVYDRVPQPAEEWLIKFISNSNNMILSGDSYAKKVYIDNGTGMMAFDTILSEKEIKDIIAYTVGASN
ncbi:MAG: cytochrome c [Bacteroidia bacterium]